MTGTKKIASFGKNGIVLFAKMPKMRKISDVQSIICDAEYHFHIQVRV